MIRVAVILGKLHAGGKKNLVMEYYRHIDRNKIQFDFICDKDSNSIPSEEIKKLGGKVYVIPPYQHIFANMKAMKRILKDHNYPIIHGYNSTMNIFSMFVGKQCGIPIRINESISMGHNNDKKNILKNVLKVFSSCFSTHYMSNGETCGRWQFGDKAFDNGKVSVFKTIIDTNKYRFSQEIREKCRKELGVDNYTVIGHIGRYTAQKNTLFIIDIFREIAQIDSNIRFVMIGHGELENEMIERINRYELNDKVINLGKREDIYQFYNAMDGFLLPSLYEGLPVVGVEAESCGLPVFFSTEIPKESSPCLDLGFFIDLEQGAEKWAKKVIKETKKLKEIRTDHSLEVKKAGFDSSTEAIKLQKYYEQQCIRRNINVK